MRRRTIVSLMVGLLTLLPGLALAGGGGGGGACAGFTSGSTVIMRDSCFEGAAHFIAAGETLVIRNDGRLPHSFTAVDGRFDTGLLEFGETAEITLDESEIIPVYCTLHGTKQGHGMAGVLMAGIASPEVAGNEMGPLPVSFMNGSATQAASIGELTSEVAALREVVVKADAERNVHLALASIPGLLGLLVAGVALKIGSRSRRPDEVDPAKS